MADEDDTVAERSSTTPSRKGIHEGAVIGGRYQMGRQLGRGGMGEVYEAIDRDLRETVALKTLRWDRVADPEAVERFRREIHLARKVTHPNVCRIYDFGSDGDVPYLTMELVRGDTLQAVIAAGALPLPRVLAIARQLAAGLHAAHEAGVVHRDFKPSNVILVGDRPVIMDFGIARGEVDDRFAAVTGAIVGSPAYMAPEQLAGKTVTRAADLYALGLVLCELATGERNDAANLPEPWASTIQRCLERDPAKRFASAPDVIAALSKHPARAWKLVGALALAGGLAGGAIALSSGATEPAAIVEPPRDPEIDRRYAAAVAALATTPANEARGAFEQLLALAPRHALAHAQLGHLWWRLGYVAKAHGELRLAREHAGAVTGVERAEIDAITHELDRDFAAAVRRYRDVAKADPANLERGLRLVELSLAAADLDSADAAVAALRARTELADDPRVEIATARIKVARGELSTARDQLRHAWYVAHTRGQHALESHAARGLLEIAMRSRDRIADALDEADDVARDNGDVALTLVATRTRAQVALDEGRPVEARRYLTTALAHARGLGDRRAQTELHTQLGLLANQMGEWTIRKAMLAEAHGDAIETGDPDTLASTTVTLAIIAIEEGRLADARRQLAELREAATRQPAIAVHVDSTHALLCLREGDLPCARATLAKLRPGIAPAIDGFADDLRGLLALLADDLPAARAIFERRRAAAEATKQRSAISQARTLAALVTLEQGNWAAAERELAAILREYPNDLVFVHRVRAYQALAIAQLRQHKPAAALATLDATRELFPQNAEPSNRYDLAIVQALAARDLPALDALIRDTRAAGLVLVELDARLAAAELRPDPALEADARAKGLALVARKAKALAR